MTTQALIERKLTESLGPTHLEVLNESHMHNVPDGSESHFKVTVVAEQFHGESLVNRHRMVNQILSEQLASSIHALSLHTMTPDEWFETSGQTKESPPCLGGSAAESKFPRST